MRYAVPVVLVVGTIVLFVVPFLPSLQLLAPGSFNSAGMFDALANLTADQFKILLSAVLVVASLFVFLSRLYGPHEQHVAYFCLGSVIGYWFKV